MAAASPWGPVVHQEPVSLSDVMSEELAKNLQTKEDAVLGGYTGLGVAGVGGEFSIEAVEEVAESAADVSNDLLLAQLLQAEFDREHDDQLKREENSFNGGSKVSVSFHKYRLCPEYAIFNSDSEPDDEYDDDADRTREWDSFESREKSAPQIPRCGYTVHEDRLVTKHDRHIAGRKNACKVMDLPPNVCTGDGGSFDMEINNGVLNSLRQHARTDSQRKQRVVDKEDRSTSSALDKNTRLMILKLVNAEILEVVNGAISTGKEAHVFHATGGSSEEINVPEECVVKVFRTTLNEFKTREKYIKGDNRFKDRIAKQNPRKLIHLWAEKELCNLKRLDRAGVRCPRALALRQHVLVMSFIGENKLPAPKLKDVQLSEQQWKDAYQQVLEMTKSMYERCSLVHADLSEYNILYHAGLCWFIDVSQSVEPFHPHALEFLYRDCTNVHRFFKTREVDAMTPEAMFSHVSGLTLVDDGDVIRQIEEHQKSELLRPRQQARSDEALLRQYEQSELEQLTEAEAGSEQRHRRHRRHKHRN